MSDMFVVAQKAVIKDGDKYLVLKRSPNAPTYPEHWDFTGGTLDAGESPSDGLAREVLEETGLIVKIIKPISTFYEKVFNRKLKKELDVIFPLYLCESDGEEIALSHEHTEYKWLTKEEILNLKIENYLRDYLKNEK